MTTFEEITKQYIDGAKNKIEQEKKRIETIIEFLDTNKKTLRPYQYLGGHINYTNFNVFTGNLKNLGVKILKEESGTEKFEFVLACEYNGSKFFVAYMRNNSVPIRFYNGDYRKEETVNSMKELKDRFINFFSNELYNILELNCDDSKMIKALNFDYDKEVIKREDIYNDIISKDNKIIYTNGIEEKTTVIILKYEVPNLERVLLTITLIEGNVNIYASYYDR